MQNNVLVAITVETILLKILYNSYNKNNTLLFVKRRKLQWFGHTTRNNTLAKEIIQGTVKGGRKLRRTQKMYMDNIRDWTGLEPQELCDAAHKRPRWRKISVEASKRAPIRSAQSRDE